MLLELLKRDLRLHYGVLVLPLVFALGLAALHPLNPDLPTLGPGLGYVLAAFMPLALHMREQNLGTLGDLASLPVSRRQIVRLRFLEALLLPLLPLLLGGAVLALITRTLPMPNASLLRAMGWTLFFCSALHLPLTLRWDSKGLLASFGLLFGLQGALALTQFLPKAMHLAFWHTFNRGMTFLTGHPTVHSLTLLALLALCYLASQRAFANRDL